MRTEQKTRGRHFAPLLPARRRSLVLNGYKESSRKIILFKDGVSYFEIGKKTIVESNANHVAVPALAFFSVRHHFGQRNHRHFQFLQQSHLLLKFGLRYGV